MRFYISWYPGDPIYPLYAQDCSMLLSPTSVSERWRLHHLERLPQRLIIDSGGFRYSTSKDQPPTAAELLARQIRIVGRTTIPVKICALDTPIAFAEASSVAVDQSIAKTLAHAYEVKRLVDTHPLPPTYELMAVVQGNSAATLKFCARELKSMGFTQWGIGSLARIPDSNAIIERIESVFSVVQSPLHLFGVGSPTVLTKIEQRMVSSVDSSSPAKAAACNEIFYSRPFRRYGILVNGEARSKFPVHRCLATPFSCHCPVCQENAHDLLRMGKRAYIRKRTLHNYFHQRWAIENIHSQ